MDLTTTFSNASQARSSLLDDKHESACRLFNGFYEGFPALAVDLYGHTLVIHDYSEKGEGDEASAKAVVDAAKAQWPWITAALWKVRDSQDPLSRNGRFLLGERGALDRRVVENGVKYSLALDLHQDATLYLDTRLLRAWAKKSFAGKKVLNTFAYTGSLGVAAAAGGAAQVVHVDLSRQYLNLAKDSYALNKLPVAKTDFKVADFFEAMSWLKKEGALFDALFLDPPFFSETKNGRVDMEKEADKLINKARPLIGDGGVLVAVNNALFTSGAQWKATLEGLCQDGYMAFEETLPVPEDFTGYPATRVGTAPADPAPFNHSTKDRGAAREAEGRPEGLAPPQPGQSLDEPLDGPTAGPAGARGAARLTGQWVRAPRSCRFGTTRRDRAPRT
ncbi:MAG: class I SAM-dependent methyltransferase [Myxococcales bacterium]